MKRMLMATLSVMMLGLNVLAQSVYDYKVKNEDGKEVSLADYKGKVLLIVNTATKCGFTPQYKELEALYEKYRAEGLEILDFPCNQFGQQAPGTAKQIRQFCTENFHIQFAQFDKIEVNGENAAPLYVYLKGQKGFCGFNTDDKIGKLLDERFKQQDPDYAKNPDIKWNFTKFLVSRDGCVLQRFEPTATAADMEPAIKAALNGGCCVKSEKTGCCAKTEKSCYKQDETACCK